MSKDIAISIKNLSKKFTKKDDREFWAIKNISFEVKKGEVIGIIGKNGAGKSTLLKILGGIQKPTKGKVEIYGNLSSILDIGTGFHPDLSGRENIYLNGKMNGLDNRFIDNVIDELIQFSELEKFIDEQVKTYSKGMYMRLAFSIFAFLKPEILLLDEVFSVGDIAFQNKCIEKINSLVKTGATILIVSHNINEIKQICSKVVVLKNGKIFDIGTTSDMVNTYLKESFLNSKEGKLNIGTHKKFNKNEANNSIINLIDVRVRARHKKIDEPIIRDDEIIIEVCFRQTIKEYIKFMLKINSVLGDVILMDSYTIRKGYVAQESNKGVYKMEIVIPKNLFNRGIFIISLILASKNTSHQNKGLEIGNIIAFEVHLTEWEKKMNWTYEIDSIFRPQLQWETIKISDS